MTVMSTLLLLLLLHACVCGLISATFTDMVWQPDQPGRLTTSTQRAHSSIADSPSLDSAPLTTALSSALSTEVLGEEGETALTAGRFVSGTLPLYGSLAYFSYKPAALNVPFDIFVGVTGCDEAYCSDIHVLMNGRAFANDTSRMSDIHYTSAIRIDSSHALSCELRNIPLADCEYHYTLRAWAAGQQYYTAVMIPPRGVSEVRGGVGQSGTLDGGSSAYYYISNSALNEILIFALTVTSGDCDLYVSATTDHPGPTNYTWSSVDDGDDLVIVNGTRPGSWPSPYYFVGVYNKRSSSSSGYTVVGSGYNVNGDPRDNAWFLEADLPQKDYAMANTYRYYYMYVTGVWTGMNITLESMRGDADIYVNVKPYPYYAGTEPPVVFPSMQDSQYNSTTSGFDQVYVRAPTAGNYVWISVYSKGVDSRYSITISGGEGRIANLYTYGYPVLAQVNARRSLYYVATMSTYYSPAVVATYRLAFTLRSLSGNADLYISDTYMYPNATHHNWTSQTAGDGLDMAVLRGDVTSGGRTELHAGNYYVGVYGNTASSFQLWSYLSNRLTLQLNSMLSYYHYGGVMYWELDVPRGAGFIIVATPLPFYGGSFNLYVGNVAEPIPSIASTYQVMMNGAVDVSPAVAPCAGSGPTCHYYVAVERINTAANETVYASFSLMTVSRDVPPPRLLPDVPLEQSSTAANTLTYQFNVTCPRSKVIVTVVMNDRSITSVPIPSPMLINRGPLPPFSALNNVLFGYAETVMTGTRTFTLTFDWNHPLLRGQSMVGNYMLSVAPKPLSYGWTLFLRVESASCAPLPAFTTMQPLVPYAATVNATSMTYFTYQTAPSASGYLYFTLSALNSSTSTSALSLLARSDGDVPTAGYAQYTGSNGVLRVAADACSNGASSNASSGGMCQYTIAVSSTAGPSSAFFLTASATQPLYTLDASTPTARLSGTVARSAATSGTAVIRRGSTTAVSLITESCMGAVGVYLNYRSAAIPTSSAADVSAMSVTSPTSLSAVLSTVNDTHLVASIVGVGAATNTFETRLLTGMSWSSASPTTSSTVLTVTDYRSVSTGYARVRIPLATQPAAITSGAIRQPAGTTGYLRYAVYMNDTASAYVTRSRCGLQASSAVLIHTAYGLTASSNWVDIRLPSSSSPSRRYTLTVLVDHVWRTTVNTRNYTYETTSAGYVIYTPVEVRSGMKTAGDDDQDSSSSGGDIPPPPSSASSGLSTSTVAIIAVIVAIVVLVALLAGVRHYMRRAGSQSGASLLGGEFSGKSSLPSDTHVQSQHQQQPQQLTGEAYYSMPAEGR